MNTDTTNQPPRSRVRRPAAAALLALACWLPHTPMRAADLGLTIATGSSGRAYYGVGERLREVGRERGLAVQVVATDGSLENLTRLADAADPVNTALTQSDVLYQFMADHPGFGAAVQVLESIGLECVFAIARADGAIDSFRAWQEAESPKVALPAPDSGVAVTHAIMATVIPELAGDQPVYLDADAAIDALSAEAGGAVDVVFSVHRAKFRGPELQAALEQPDRFRIIPITDKRLKLEFADGTPVYQQVDLPLVRGSAAGNVSVETLGTMGLLVAAPAKLGDAAQAALQQIIDYDWMRVYPQPR
jgi:TRAP-type uncharacterized transport system substrate-binding protein